MNITLVRDPRIKGASTRSALGDAMRNYNSTNFDVKRELEELRGSEVVVYAQAFAIVRECGERLDILYCKPSHDRPVIAALKANEVVVEPCNNLSVLGRTAVAWEFRKRHTVLFGQGDEQPDAPKFLRTHRERHKLQSAGVSKSHSGKIYDLRGYQVYAQEWANAKYWFNNGISDALDKRSRVNSIDYDFEELAGAMLTAIRIDCGLGGFGVVVLDLVKSLANDIPTDAVISKVVYPK